MVRRRRKPTTSGEKPPVEHQHRVINPRGRIITPMYPIYLVIWCEWNGLLVPLETGEKEGRWGNQIVI